MFYVVLLAMVAGFLAMRLYSVLGKRTGQEPPLVRAEERLAPVPMPRAVEPVAEARAAAASNIDDGAATGLRAIVAADPKFDVPQFLDGAQAAYRMVLEAFWKADETALGHLVEPDVLDAFKAAIAQRATAGHTLDNRLVGIEKAAIVDAGVDNKVGRIVVRFDADIAAVTRDADGTVVAGSTSDAVETHDIWTFTRALKSGDPNWKLAETDEA